MEIKILLVSNNTETQELIETHIQKLQRNLRGTNSKISIHLTTATSGSDAAQYYRIHKNSLQAPFDLVLMDDDMPQGSCAFGIVSILNFDKRANIILYSTKKPSFTEKEIHQVIAKHPEWKKTDTRCIVFNFSKPCSIYDVCKLISDYCTTANNNVEKISSLVKLKN